MRREGAYWLLVSGGFSAFADRVAGAIGFDGAVANTLLVEEGRLSGTVGEPIVGAEGKLQALIDAAEARAIELGESLAIGAGANAIPMLKAAGLGVPSPAQPTVRAYPYRRNEYGDESKKRRLRNKG